MKDSIIFEAIQNELKRQETHIELIASENYVSEDVRLATGSVMTNKYAEGYPGKRYYDGCEFVDIVEKTAISRLKKLFGVKYANVQPHSGSQANFAVYTGLLKPGDTILGMKLDSGGHLTHGFHVSASGKFFNAESYEVDENGWINYDDVERIVMEKKPKLIITGYSAYPREIDFPRFRKIADKVGAYLMADIAHIAGMVATNVHSSPVGYAHVITSTTHKTLRGARGGIIMTNDEEIFKKINKGVFPATQGGPLMNQIAGKAVAFYEALQPDFIKYNQQIVSNAKAFANKFISKGVKIITGGTDNHIFTIDVKTSYGITGKEASKILSASNITVNKNTIPNDEESPFVTSGIRLGTPAMTSRGFTETEFEKLADIIHNALKNKNETYFNKVKNLASNFKIKKFY